MLELKIASRTPYSLLLESGIVKRIGQFLPNPPLHLAVLSDQKVWALYGQALLSGLKEYSVSTLILPPGESQKNWSNLGRILEFLAAERLERQDWLLTLGGGVISDLGGLAAGLYRRGIAYGQIPTTLLAATDACLGGKTAVDLSQGKNLAGLFWPPRLVGLDLAILQSLPDELFAQGMPEIIKHALIKSPALADKLEQGHWRENLAKILLASLQIKKFYIEADELEQGIRQELNFGHTLGHAWEKLSNYQISHGQAVAWGMLGEVGLGEQLEICQTPVRIVLEKLLAKLPFGRPPAGEAQKLTKLMQNDKKNQAQKIVFCLPKALGDCQRIALTAEQVESLLGRV